MSTLPFSPLTDQTLLAVSSQLFFNAGARSESEGVLSNADLSLAVELQHALEQRITGSRIPRYIPGTQHVEVGARTEAVVAA